MPIISIPQTLFGPNQPLGIPVRSPRIDLTAIVSPVLNVTRPDGSVVTWAAAVVPYDDNSGTVNSTITPTMANFQYVLLSTDLSAGGTAWLGLWGVEPAATLIGNPVKWYSTSIRVTDPWGRR